MVNQAMRSVVSVLFVSMLAAGSGTWAGDFESEYLEWERVPIPEQPYTREALIKHLEKIDELQTFIPPSFYQWPTGPFTLNGIVLQVVFSDPAVHAKRNNCYAISQVRPNRHRRYRVKSVRCAPAGGGIEPGNPIKGEERFIAEMVNPSNPSRYRLTKIVVEGDGHASETGHVGWMYVLADQVTLEPFRDPVTNMPFDVEFDFDKSDIKPVYHDEIKKLADFMKKYLLVMQTISLSRSR